MPGTVLSAPHMLTFSILTATLRDRCYFSPHFKIRKLRKRDIKSLSPGLFDAGACMCSEAANSGSFRCPAGQLRDRLERWPDSRPRGVQTEEVKDAVGWVLGCLCPLLSTQCEEKHPCSTTPLTTPLVASAVQVGRWVPAGTAGSVAPLTGLSLEFWRLHRARSCPALALGRRQPLLSPGWAHQRAARQPAGWKTLPSLV